VRPLRAADAGFPILVGEAGVRVVAAAPDDLACAAEALDGGVVAGAVEGQRRDRTDTDALPAVTYPNYALLPAKMLVLDARAAMMSR